MLSLPQPLVEKERKVCLEYQATHDICSRNGAQADGCRTTLDMGSHSAEDKEGLLLEKLDIICRKESKVAMATSPPPALIHHLDVSDDVIRIKGNFITSLSLVIIQGYR